MATYSESVTNQIVSRKFLSSGPNNIDNITNRFLVLLILRKCFSTLIDKEGSKLLSPLVDYYPINSLYLLLYNVITVIMSLHESVNALEYFA